jgi:microcystin-dependent protein
MVSFLINDKGDSQMNIKNILPGILLAAACCSGVSTVNAGSEPFIGEVQWFAGNFAPRGWAFCDGQLLPINQHQALFSLLGTMYGGDGRTNFALPDVRGRVLIHAGQGPGLSSHFQGNQGGTETETLTVNQVPAHTHTLRASAGDATDAAPAGKVLASSGRTRLYDSGVANADMNASAITTSGGNQPHNNMQPYLTLSCIIALQGIFPSRN